MRKVTKVVIPVAGFGTRMFPGSKSVPKCLFPIVSRENDVFLTKPIVMVILEEALSAFSSSSLDSLKIAFVVSPTQLPIMEDFFFTPVGTAYLEKKFLKNSIDLLSFVKDRITFVVQKVQNGFGDAILCCKEFVGEDNFLMLLGDLIYKSFDDKKRSCAKQIVEAFEKFSEFDSVVSMTLCGNKLLQLNGVVVGKPIQIENEELKLDIERVVEKPTLDLAKKELFLTGIQKCFKEDVKKTQRLKDLTDDEDLYPIYFGIDCFSPKIFLALERCLENKIFTNKELNLRDAQNWLVQEMKEKSLGVFVNGEKLDCGLPQPYLQSLISFCE